MEQDTSYSSSDRSFEATFMAKQQMQRRAKSTDRNLRRAVHPETSSSQSPSSSRNSAFTPPVKKRGSSRQPPWTDVFPNQQTNMGARGSLTDPKPLNDFSTPCILFPRSVSPASSNESLSFADLPITSSMVASSRGGAPPQRQETTPPQPKIHRASTERTHSAHFTSNRDTWAEFSAEPTRNTTGRHESTTQHQHFSPQINPSLGHHGPPALTIDTLSASEETSWLGRSLLQAPFSPSKPTVLVRSERSAFSETEGHHRHRSSSISSSADSAPRQTATQQYVHSSPTITSASTFSLTNAPPLRWPSNGRSFPTAAHEATPHKPTPPPTRHHHHHQDSTLHSSAFTQSQLSIQHHHSPSIGPLPQPPPPLPTAQSQAHPLQPPSPALNASFSSSTLNLSTVGGGAEKELDAVKTLQHEISALRVQLEREKDASSRADAEKEGLRQRLIEIERSYWEMKGALERAEDRVSLLESRVTDGRGASLEELRGELLASARRENEELKAFAESCTFKISELRTAFQDSAQAYATHLAAMDSEIKRLGIQVAQSRVLQVARDRKAQEISSEVEESEARHVGELHGLTQRLSQLTADNESLSQRLAEAERERAVAIEECAQHKRTAEECKSDMQRAVNDRNLMEDRLHSTLTTLENLTGQLVDMQRAGGNAAALVSLENEVARLKQVHVEETQRMASEIDDLSETIRQKESELESLRAQLSESQTHASAKTKELQSRVLDFQKQCEDLKSTLHTSTSKLERLSKENETLQTQLASALASEQTRQSLELDHVTLQERCRGLEAQVCDLQAMTERHLKEAANVSHLERSLAQSVSRAKIAESALEDFKSKANELENLNQILKLELEKCRGEKDDVETQISTSRADFEKSERQREKLESEISALRADGVALRTLAEEREEAIKGLKRELEERERSMSAVEQVGQLLKDLHRESAQKGQDYELLKREIQEVLKEVEDERSRSQTQHETKINDLSQQIAQLSTTASLAESERNRAKEELKIVATKLKEVGDECVGLREKLGRREAEIGRLSAKLEEKEKLLDHHHRQFLQLSTSTPPNNDISDHNQNEEEGHDNDLTSLKSEFATLRASYERVSEELKSLQSQQGSRHHHHDDSGPSTPTSVQPMSVLRASSSSIGSLTNPKGDAAAVVMSDEALRGFLVETIQQAISTLSLSQKEPNNGDITLGHRLTSPNATTTTPHRYSNPSDTSFAFSGTSPIAQSEQSSRGKLLLEEESPSVAPSLVRFGSPDDNSHALSTRSNSQSPSSRTVEKTGAAGVHPRARWDFAAPPPPLLDTLLSPARGSPLRSPSQQPPNTHVANIAFPTRPARLSSPSRAAALRAGSSSGGAPTSPINGLHHSLSSLAAQNKTVRSLESKSFGMQRSGPKTSLEEQPPATPAIVSVKQEPFGISVRLRPPPASTAPSPSS